MRQLYQSITFSRALMLNFCSFSKSSDSMGKILMGRKSQKLFKSGDFGIEEIQATFQQLRTVLKYTNLCVRTL